MRDLCINLCVVTQSRLPAPMNNIGKSNRAPLRQNAAKKIFSSDQKTTKNTICRNNHQDKSIKPECEDCFFSKPNICGYVCTLALEYDFSVLENFSEYL